MASFLSTPLIAAETALAADAAFLLWCGATSAADAKANYIFSDDPKKDADLPAKYAVISEMKDWSYNRSGMGAGKANFQFQNGAFEIVFSEESGLTEDVAYTPTKRIAFKDQIAGFIDAFISNFENNNRLNNVSQVPWTDQFPFRGQVIGENGQYAYQYGIRCEVGKY